MRVQWENGGMGNRKWGMLATLLTVALVMLLFVTGALLIKTGFNPLLIFINGNPVSTRSIEDAATKGLVVARYKGEIKIDSNIHAQDPLDVRVVDAWIELPAMNRGHVFPATSRSTHQYLIRVVISGQEAPRYGDAWMVMSNGMNLGLSASPGFYVLECHSSEIRRSYEFELSLIADSTNWKYSQHKVGRLLLEKVAYRY